MPLSPDAQTQAEEVLNKIATEQVLARPGSDEGLIPAYALLTEWRDVIESEPVLSEGVTVLMRELDELLDSAEPFDEKSLKALSDFVVWAQLALRQLTAGEPPDPFDLVLEKEVAAQTEAEIASGAEAAVVAQHADDDLPEAPETPVAPEAAAPRTPDTTSADEQASVAAETDVLLAPNLAEDAEILAEFRTEATEHLEAIESNVLTLEQEPEEPESLRTLFRAFHTIKGVAGFLHLTPIQALAHEVETLLDHARNGKLTIDTTMVTLILESRDVIQALVGQVARALDEGVMPETVIPVAHLIVRARQASAAGLAVARGEPTPLATAAAAPPPPAPIAPGTPPPGEPPAETLPATSRETAPAPAKAAPSPGGNGTRSVAQTQATIRVNTGKLDNLMDMVGELVIVQSQLSESARREQAAMTDNAPMQRNLQQLARITKELQHTSMALRMIPIKSTFQKMGRIVRDVANNLGKEVSFTTSGDDTELDRNMVELLNDPLVHMMRNSVDHGLEAPEAREAVGKPRTGKVELKAYHMGGSIVIELNDDGAGIDPQKILAKARDRGLVEEGRDYTPQEAYQFLFAAGFSTAAKLSDVSGRGVGLDVVRKNIEGMRGTVEIESELGKGTTFKIKLPLTMAIIDGLLVQVGNDRFIIPTTAVNVALRPERKQLSTVKGKAEILDLRGKTIVLQRLHRLFHVEGAIEDPCEAIVVIIEHLGVPTALMVDQMLSKQEVVIKNLGALLHGIQGVAGGAILGDGTIALILDPASLVALGRKTKA